MKRILGVLLITVLALNANVKAADFSQPTKIRCTCYTAKQGAITASGEPVREGIIAAKKSWIGKTAIIYDMDMNLIGVFEIKDTGAGIDTDGDGKGDSIINGKSIDVFRNTLDGCYEWVGKYGDYVYFQIIEGEQK